MIPELAWILQPKHRQRRLPSGWPMILVVVVMVSVMLSAIASLYGMDSDSGFLRYAPWYLFAVFLEFVSFAFARDYADAQRRIREFAASLEQKVEERTRELKAAAAEIRTLQGILPICMYCHKIRDDHESWQQLELYLKEHSDAEFSHGLCPQCMKEHYPDIAEGE
jgi:C4-dicarboxylate-specific signal transduction histidine kinase